MLAASRYSSLASALTVVAMIALAWAISFWAGGSRSVAPHLFYVPTILAAARFGNRGALVTAVACGLAAGPLLPLVVETGVQQETLSWVLRGGAFVMIGQMTAFLCRHSQASVTRELSNLMIRRELRLALEARHLHLEYQPIIELPSGRMVGVEALLRWMDPARGPRPPAEFIPLVEQAGAAGVVSEFVVEEACQQVATWARTGVVDAQGDFKLAVNISGTELQDRELEERVRRVLRTSGIRPGWLHLEVTETALIEDIETAIVGLQRLRGAGARLAIDDFGAGETSLQYLHRFPVDTVKIDRSFVVSLAPDDRGVFILKSVVDLAHDMSIVTVAEGVETAEQVEVLCGVGCDMAQGYHFARPLSPLAFEQMALAGTPGRQEHSNQ